MRSGGQVESGAGVIPMSRVTEEGVKLHRQSEFDRPHCDVICIGGHIYVRIHKAKRDKG